MDCYSRDFLCRFGMGDATAQEQGAPRVEMEDVELSLGLSLGGRFGLDRKREMLVRSSSVAAMLTLPVVVTPPPPPALPRTSSLPVEAEASEGGIESGAVRVEDAARRPSGSPSSGSSDAEEHGLQGTLIRTGSLPAGIEAVGTEELRKRKAAQSLKRLEVKKKRIERKNSLSNVSKEAVGQIAGEINANAEKSQCSLSAAQKKPNSAFKGTAMAEEHSSSSSTQSPGSAKDASPPLPARAVALGSWGGQQNISGGAAARAGSAGDLQRRMMKEMPGVFYSTTVNRVDGFLYDYRKGAQLRIVCLCHGNFLTPAEFIEHAGGAEVENPLQHIVVNEGQNL